MKGLIDLIVGLAIRALISLVWWTPIVMGFGFILQWIGVTETNVILGFGFWRLFLAVFLTNVVWGFVHAAIETNRMRSNPGYEKCNQVLGMNWKTYKRNRDADE